VALLLRGGDERAQDRDDLLMLGQHAGQLGREPVGHRHGLLSIVRRRDVPALALGQDGQEPERRHRELLLREEVRVQALSHATRGLPGAAALGYGGLEVVMQVIVLILERLWDGKAHGALPGVATTT
jgi:hypothetical protein